MNELVDIAYNGEATATGAGVSMLQNWLVAKNQPVVPHQTIAKLRAGGVQVDIESPVVGRLQDILVAQGQSVRPGQIIGRVLVHISESDTAYNAQLAQKIKETHTAKPQNELIENANGASAPPMETAPPDSTNGTDTDKSSTQETETEAEEAEETVNLLPSLASIRPLNAISQEMRQLMRKHNIANLDGISGTGCDGRVTRTDLLEWVAHNPQLITPDDSADAEVPPIPSPVIEENDEAQDELEVFAKKTEKTITALEQYEQAQTNLNGTDAKLSATTATEQIAESTGSNQAERFAQVENFLDGNEDEDEQMEFAVALLTESANVVLYELETAPAEHATPTPEAKITPAPAESTAPPVAEPTPKTDKARKLVTKQVADTLLNRIPHISTTFEINIADEILAGDKLHARFLQAIAAAMRAVPALNAHYVADELILKDDINVGIRTALPNGKMVSPVIVDVQNLELDALAKELQTANERAQNARIRADELQLGTFSIFAHGKFGSVLASPLVITPPQVATLGIGTIQKTPQIVDGSITIGAHCYATLTVDARAIDEYQSNRWLTTLKNTLET